MNDQWLFVDKGGGIGHDIPAHTCRNCNGTGRAEENCSMKTGCCLVCMGDGLVPDDCDPNDDNDSRLDAEKGN